MKRCRKCGLELPLEKFTVAKQNKSGYTSTCKDCNAAYMREYYSRNPEQYSKHKGYVKINDQTYKNVHFLYGLSKEQFNKLLARYDGMCWSCKEEPANHIDHDHSCCPRIKKQGAQRTCGKCIRGILCAGCNTGMGLFKDNIDRLQKAIDYLSNMMYVSFEGA